nr:MAG TPA: hypothetical protein [Caudoviricetes sp.]
MRKMPSKPLFMLGFGKNGVTTFSEFRNHFF